MSETVYRAEAGDAGTRLDVWMSRRLDVSRARAQKLLEGAALNGASAKSSHVLREGDEVTLQRTQSVSDGLETAAASHDADAMQPVADALGSFLFQDDALLVLNKSRGLTVHAGAGTGDEPTLIDVLRAQGVQLSSVGAPDRPGIVHRLDRDTSGVMAVCKSDAAHWKLAADFAERRVDKEYLALVCGVPASRGRIEAPIGRHPVDRKKMAVAPSGRPAVTEYSVERSWAKFALVRVRLLTGRTHQIRVHFQKLGFPIVGDETYGGRHRAEQSAPDAAFREALSKLQGQGLHAAKLSFSHPVTGEPLAFEAPLPDEMQALLEALG